MIDPQSIDLTALPWVPLEATAGFPARPGIYFAIDSLNQIQYIGRSVNVRNRWKNHHRYDDLAEIGNIRIAYLFVDTPELLPEIESALIKWFRPSLNHYYFASIPEKDKDDTGEKGVDETKSEIGIRVVKELSIDVPNLGQRIKDARKRDSRSLREIAGLAGMTTMNWHRIETEKQSLPIETLRQIEKVLNVDFGVSFDSGEVKQ